MEVTIYKEKHMVTVRKEKGDPIFHRTYWGLAESTFLHHVKLELIKQGYDWYQETHVERRSFG